MLAPLLGTGNNGVEPEEEVVLAVGPISRPIFRDIRRPMMIERKFALRGGGRYLGRGRRK